MWFKKKIQARPEEKLVLPEGLWVKCESCGEILYRSELEKNIWICPKCNFHFRIGSRDYIALLLDDGKLEELDVDMEPLDPLDFPDYKKKLKSAQQTTKMKDGLIYGNAKIGGIPVVFAAMDFAFMGGSMGSVVGEKVARAIRLARKEKKPLIIVSTSGGARMQEGIFSLMQLSKTSTELALLAKERVPYISILTHPTMAGVMASYASLGDIIIAEPGALIGFTGPRVIEQTIGEKLPPGFQRSEFMLEHGMIDLLVSRTDLRNTLIRILKIIYKVK
jgi:acetyl-CoA carboxylase carboxyl transferase subunit beta|uniref:Acetyl-coenzyme A carboxylase carboxyl transferase subunit beta n=1 Tax=candidate division WOR-3 bacterium TaxID=2052148 RepID=A0A7V3RI89_UNCW3